MLKLLVVCWIFVIPVSTGFWSRTIESEDEKCDFVMSSIIPSPTNSEQYIISGFQKAIEGEDCETKAMIAKVERDKIIWSKHMKNVIVNDMSITTSKKFVMCGQYEDKYSFLLKFNEDGDIEDEYITIPSTESKTSVSVFTSNDMLFYIGGTSDSTHGYISHFSGSSSPITRIWRRKYFGSITSIGELTKQEDKPLIASYVTGGGEAGILKLEKEYGDVLWAKRIHVGGTIEGSGHIIYQIKESFFDGSIIVVGAYVYGSGGRSDALLMKISSEDGSVIWSKVIDPEMNAHLFRFIEDSEGNIISIGYIDVSPTMSSTTHDVVVVKVTGAGYLMWYSLMDFSNEAEEKKYDYGLGIQFMMNNDYKKAIVCGTVQYKNRGKKNNEDDDENSGSEDEDETRQQTFGVYSTIDLETGEYCDSKKKKRNDFYDVVLTEKSYSTIDVVSSGGDINSVVTIPSLSNETRLISSSSSFNDDDDEDDNQIRFRKICGSKLTTGQILGIIFGCYGYVLFCSCCVCVLSISLTGALGGSIYFVFKKKEKIMKEKQEMREKKEKRLRVYVGSVIKSSAKLVDLEKFEDIDLDRRLHGDNVEEEEVEDVELEMEQDESD